MDKLFSCRTAVVATHAVFQHSALVGTLWITPAYLLARAPAPFFLPQPLPELPATSSSKCPLQSAIIMITSKRHGFSATYESKTVYINKKRHQYYEKHNKSTGCGLSNYCVHGGLCPELLIQRLLYLVYMLQAQADPGKMGLVLTIPDGDLLTDTLEKRGDDRFYLDSEGT